MNLCTEKKNSRGLESCSSDKFSKGFEKQQSHKKTILGSQKTIFNGLLKKPRLENVRIRKEVTPHRYAGFLGGKGITRVTNIIYYKYSGCQQNLAQTAKMPPF